MARGRFWVIYWDEDTQKDEIEEEFNNQDEAFLCAEELGFEGFRCIRVYDTMTEKETAI